MPRFRAETLSKIRHRIGHLRHGDKFLTGNPTASAASTITMAAAAMFPNDHFAGRVVHVVSGPGAGETHGISASAQGSGVITVSPSWIQQPGTDSLIEIWPEGATPQQVNNAINLSVMDVSDVVQPKAYITDADVDWVLSVTRDVITLPDDWTRVTAVNWFTGDRGYVKAMYEEQPHDNLDWTPRYDIVPGHQLKLSAALDASVTDITVIGYRLPRELVADVDVSEVRSDYLVYKAASVLEAENVAGPQNDPDNHSLRSQAWLAQAAAIRAQMHGDYDPGTIDLV